MGYKIYRVNEEDMRDIRSSTDGFQPKFIVDNNSKFIKMQCELNKTLRDDWRVEDIASRICDQLNIYSVHQTPCKIIMTSKKGVEIHRMGVVSKNFETEGYEFISYNRMIGFQNIDESDISFRQANSIQKIDMIANTISNYSGLPKQGTLLYVLNLLLVDLLVLNQDRHFSNFGIFYNAIANKFSIARIFDCGMGLFENESSFDNMTTLEECMRYSYIAPYGDDPFELAYQLKNTNLGYKYLKTMNVKRLHIDRNLFINKLGYEYYVKIKKALEV